MRFSMEKPTWEGTEGDFEPSTCKELTPQCNSPQGTESGWQSCEWAGNWILPSWALRWLSPWETPRPRETHLSCPWIPDPQRLWNNKYCLSHQFGDGWFTQELTVTVLRTNNRAVRGFPPADLRPRTKDWGAGAPGVPHSSPSWLNNWVYFLSSCYTAT